MYVPGSSRPTDTTSEELSITTRSPARPARTKARVALRRRQTAHHSTDHRLRIQRPLDGGRRRAQGMWSGPGPGQWAGVAGAQTTETTWPAEQSEARAASAWQPRRRETT
eukprot:5646078-Alexandrium_andersonii.AAC.1